MISRQSQSSCLSMCSTGLWQRNKLKYVGTDASIQHHGIIVFKSSLLACEPQTEMNGGPQ